MTANEALDGYMRGLSARVRIAKSRDIRKFCGVSRFVLSDWRRGRVKISAEKQSKITEALEQDIFCEGES